MKTLSQFINEQLSKSEIDRIEKYADKLFAAIGIDVDLSGRHFYDRVNDARNGKEIDTDELIELFNKTFKLHGKKLSTKGSGFESIIKDLNTDINLPFILKYDSKNDEIDMVAKTIMRKKNFKSTNTILKVY